MARLDTGWHVNPKVLRLGLAGMGLHAWSISYCDHARSDGFVPSGAWPSLPGARLAVTALVQAGLWEATDGGYMLHDYSDYNRTRAQIQAEQETWKTRQSRHRSRRDKPVTDTVTHASVTPDVTRDMTRDTRARGRPGPGPGVNPAAAAASYPVSGSGEMRNSAQAREVSPELMAQHEHYLARERAAKQAAAAAADLLT